MNMTDKDQQLEQFREAVDRKAEAAQEGRPHFGRPADEERDPSQDAPSPRQKSTGHGKVTADKWNQ
jgi:hypothetical protein